MSERSAMSVADAEAYTDAVAQVSSGNWQQILWAHQQGIPLVLGMTTEEWVKERIGGYIRFSISDRREVVQELTSDGLSQREIAAVMGVDEKTVRNDVHSRAENSAPDVPKPAQNAGSGDAGAENSAPPAIHSEETPLYDAPLLSVVDLETGEVINESKLIDLAERDQQERRRLDVMYFESAATMLWSLLHNEPESLAERWVDGLLKKMTVDSLSHLQTGDGLRQLAKRIEALAAAVDRRGGLA